MRKHIVPDVVKEQELAALPGTAKVRQAAKMMRDRQIKSILVLKGEKLAGIVTVSDIVKRVVAVGRDPDTTRLSTIMTKDPTTVDAGDSPIRALRIMDECRCWHMPVTDGGRVVGILSRSDFEGEEYKESDHQAGLWERLR